MPALRQADPFRLRSDGPGFENALQLWHGPIRLMIVLERFKGWEIGALWEDLKFYVGHRRDFERISVVGHSRLEEWGTLLSRPFFGAKMRFFDVEDRDTAAAWLSEGKGEGRSGLEENTEKLK